MPRLVPGEGPITSCKICFIGEALGAQEERIGRPFIGVSGQYLMKIMALVGLARGDVYLTNIVKEHPPGDDISPFFKPSRYEAWVSDKYREYQALLKDELDGCSANVLVPLGNPALYALTGLTNITKRRGSILESTLFDRPRKVIPTIHPAAALRQYIYTHFIRMDLLRVVEEAKTPDINLPTREIMLGPTYLEALSYLDLIISEVITPIAFDIEVTNEEVSCISFAISSTNCMSIPFSYSQGPYMTPEDECQVWRRIATLLEDKRITKVGQNIVFDATFLYRKYGIRTYNTEDTMIAQGIYMPDFPKGLDFITSMYTHEPYYKDIGRRILSKFNVRKDG